MELDEAFAWCESQVVWLGYGFLDEFNRAVHLIVTFPELYQQIRMLAKARLTGARAGKLVKPKLEMLEQTLRLHLGL